MKILAGRKKNSQRGQDVMRTKTNQLQEEIFIYVRIGSPKLVRERR